MPTIKEARSAAGARYAAAINELSNALVELAALDRAITNLNIIARGDGESDARISHQMPRFVPDELRHPEFAPGAGRDLHEAARARCERIIASGP